jgi:folate-binding protein YgfZ
VTGSDPRSEAQEQALVEGAGLIDGRDRGSVLVTGPDASSFLHSLLSQDVAGLAPGEGAHALLLQPQGKLDCDLRLLVIGPEEIRLDCEAGRGEALAASLRRFKLRVKVEVEDTTGSWGSLGLRGRRAPEVAEAAAGVAPPTAGHGHVSWPDRSGIRIVRADWPGGWPGIDVAGPTEALTGVWDPLVEAGATPVGAGAFEAARVAAGVPRQGVDIDERTIPQEAFLERDAVSFTKGCFLGQELVCRIDTRGHVNRYLRGFVMAPGEGDDTTPPPGAGIVVGDKEVGTLTTVARSAAGIRALGYLRREVEVPVDVRVRWEGGEVSARADALPERG